MIRDYCIETERKKRSKRRRKMKTRRSETGLRLFVNSCAAALSIHTRFIVVVYIKTCYYLYNIRDIKVTAAAHSNERRFFFFFLSTGDFRQRNNQPPIIRLHTPPSSSSCRDETWHDALYNSVCTYIHLNWILFENNYYHSSTIRAEMYKMKITRVQQ